MDRKFLVFVALSAAVSAMATGCGGDDADCTTGPECPSGVCFDGACVEPTCTDAVRNGTETGVDCGGPCGVCDGDPCTAASDCATGACQPDGLCGSDVCAGDPCTNGGACEPDGVGGYSCACPAGRFDDGATCALCPAIANCAAVTCTNAQDAMCTTCAPGHELDGSACVAVGPCADEPCGASGTCVALDDDAYRCDCEAGAFNDGSTCVACTEVAGCVGALTCTNASDSVCGACDDGRFGPTCAACPTIEGCSGVVTCESADDATCSECESGRFGPTCQPCAAIDSCAGQVTCTSADDSSCSVCADGFFGDRCAPCSPVAGCTGDVTCTSGSDSQCSECDPGTYGPTCAPCPAITGCISGLACTSSADGTCAQCAPGRFGPECTPCTAVDGCTNAIRCTDATDSVCEACPEGTFGDQCTPCAPIAGCLGAVVCTSASDSVCLECPVGTFGPQCTPCADIAACEGSVTCTTANNSQCSVCADGTFGAQCTPCTPVDGCEGDVTCAGPSDSVCSACPEGTFGPQCSPCAPVEGCLGGLTCSNPNDSTCSTCPAGTYGPLCTPCAAVPGCVGAVECTSASDSTCAECELGRFGSSCEPCPDIVGCSGQILCGSETDGTCSECVPGRFGPTCEVCPSISECEGEVTCDSAGNSVCDDCADGFFGARCTACSPIAGCTGVVSCTTGSDSQCSQCEAGTFGPTCAACPAIEGCASGLSCSSSADATCAQCAQGRFGDQCTPCSPVDGCANAVTCTDATDSVCSQCPTGTFGDQCTECTAIEACLGSVTCSDADDSVCSQCPAGTFGPQCTPCADIAACEGDVTCTTANNSKCSACAAGTFGDQCTPCADIAACDGGITCSNSSDSTCSQCEDGFFGDTCTSCAPVPGCLGLTTCTSALDGACSSCPQGTFGPQCTACTPIAACAGGLTCEGSDASTCETCADGFFGPTCAACTPLAGCDALVCAASEASTCTRCASGFALVDGACVDIDACGEFPCGLGGECADIPGTLGTSASDRTCACVAGTYYDGAGEACAACTPVDGCTAVECTAADVSVCTSCEPGYTLIEGACVDIDACELHPCDPNATCTDMPGGPASAAGRTCECDDGLIGDGTWCSRNLCVTDLGFDLIISGVAHDATSGATTVEFFAGRDIPDAGVYRIGYEGEDGEPVYQQLPPGPMPAGSHITVTSDAQSYETFFGEAADGEITSLPAALGGYLAFALYTDELAVVDTYGVLGASGQDTAWDYRSGWAYRRALASVRPSADFAPWQWDITPGGFGACNSNLECPNPYPLRAFSATQHPPGVACIPPGTFTMGSPTDEVGRNTDEKLHEVSLTRGFYMDVTEVTQGEWKALSGGVNPSNASSCGDDCPVERVDWYSALAFANAKSEAEGLSPCYTLTGCTNTLDGWTNGQHSGCTGATFAGLDCTGYRLPTESEWEYAARAGTTTATYAGDLVAPVNTCDPQPALEEIAWWCGNTDRTRPVGQKASNSWGLYDMLGNVWEWTWDRAGAYPDGPVKDPLGPSSGSNRPFRGGSYTNNAGSVRSAVRVNFGGASLQGNDIGLRLVRTVPACADGFYGDGDTCTLCPTVPNCEGRVTCAADGSASVCEGCVVGSFEPLCASCPDLPNCDATDCMSASVDDTVCVACSDGFYLDAGACVDIDACDEFPCGLGGECTDIPGTLGTSASDRTCACVAGTYYDGPTEACAACTPVDGCTAVECTAAGASTCTSCEPGYALESGSCVDIDACDAFPCDLGGECTDIPGTLGTSASDRTCACVPGTYYDSADLACAACTPVDGCTAVECTAADVSACTSCEPGYALESGSCVDIDACDEFPCGVDAVCTDIPGTLGTSPIDRICECPSGTFHDGEAEGCVPCGLEGCPPSGMALIPAGTFTMGSPTTELGRSSSETQHTVTLTRGFWMQKTEVTQGQWKALSGGTNPSLNKACGDSCPVEQVDWYSAVAYANALSVAEGLSTCYTLPDCTDATDGWKDGVHAGCSNGVAFAGLDCLGYRLPTESEWEYATRAGTTTATYAGDLSGTVNTCNDPSAQDAVDGIAWWCRNSGADGGGANRRTQPVARKLANGWGLYDVSGNVWEWTWDRFGTYPGTVTDPLGHGSGANRVFRGGSYNDHAQNQRSAMRVNLAPTYRNNHVGFRLVRTVPPIPCEPGYAAVGRECVDIDACGEFPCGLGGACTDIPGTLGTSAGDRTCACVTGTYYDGDTEACAVCTPVSGCAGVECAAAGASTCTSCESGYALEGGSCVDIDACAAFPCGLGGACTDTPGTPGTSAADRTCACVTGTFFDDADLVCAACAPIDGCLGEVTCTNATNSVCSQCPEATYGEQCTPCGAVDNCVGPVSCIDGQSSTCGNCAAGHYGPSCTPCEPVEGGCEGTVTCTDATDSECSFCPTGTWGSQCQEQCTNIANCWGMISCSNENNSACSQCATGYFGPQCTACTAVPGCLSVSCSAAGASTCLVCEEGLTLVGGACVQANPCGTQSPLAIGTVVHRGGLAVIEFFVIDAEITLGAYGIRIDGEQTVALPDVPLAESHIRLTNDADTYWDLGFFVDVTGVVPELAQLDGRTAFELIRLSDGAILDVYGQPAVSGDGSAWDYRDGYAVRMWGTAPSELFSQNDWQVDAGSLAFCEPSNCFAPFMGYASFPDNPCGQGLCQWDGGSEYTCACAEGSFFDTESGQCASCSLGENCAIATCTSASDSTCASCDPGYFGPGCEACVLPEHCATGTCTTASDATCTTCGDGFSVVDGECLPENPCKEGVASGSGLVITGLFSTASGIRAIELYAFEEISNLSAYRLQLAREGSPQPLPPEPVAAGTFVVLTNNPMALQGDFGADQVLTFSALSSLDANSAVITLRVASTMAAIDTYDTQLGQSLQARWVYRKDGTQPLADGSFDVDAWTFGENLSCQSPLQCPVPLATYAATLDPCGSGTCTVVGEGYTCACPAGEFDNGETCQPCNPVAGCVAAVTCGDETDSVCELCEIGSYEPSCETCPAAPNCDITDCTSPDALECLECSIGYYLVDGTCVALDPCDDDDPCRNGGVCGVLGEEVVCDCRGTGYEGATCEDDVDECLANPSPCGSGGYCDNAIGSYTCNCFEGYGVVGGTCVDIDACEEHPCAEGADCVDRAAPAGNDPDGRQCVCPSGSYLVGDGCTACTPIAECAIDVTCSGPSSTCGECNEGYAGATCATCAPGFSPDGDVCVPTNPCSPPASPLAIAGVLHTEGFSAIELFAVTDVSLEDYGIIFAAGGDPTPLVGGDLVAGGHISFASTFTNFFRSDVTPTELPALAALDGLTGFAIVRLADLTIVDIFGELGPQAPDVAWGYKFSWGHRIADTFPSPQFDLSEWYLAPPMSTVFCFIASQCGVTFGSYDAYWADPCGQGVCTPGVDLTYTCECEPGLYADTETSTCLPCEAINNCVSAICVGPGESVCVQCVPAFYGPQCEELCVLDEHCLVGTCAADGEPTCTQCAPTFDVIEGECIAQNPCRPGEPAVAPLIMTALVSTQWFVAIELHANQDLDLDAAYLQTVFMQMSVGAGTMSAGEKVILTSDPMAFETAFGDHPDVVFVQDLDLAGFMPVSLYYDDDAVDSFNWNGVDYSWAARALGTQPVAGGAFDANHWEVGSSEACADPWSTDFMSICAVAFGVYNAGNEPCGAGTCTVSGDWYTCDCPDGTVDDGTTCQAQ